MLSFYLPTAIFVIINLLVLYFILKRLLFKPVTKFMENRSKSISDAIANANEKKAAAEELHARYDEKLRQIDSESYGLIEESRNKAVTDYEEMMVRAKSEYESLMAKARENIENERQEMLREVRNQVASLALSAASRLLQRNMDNDANRDLIEAFINEEGVA